MIGRKYARRLPVVCLALGVLPAGCTGSAVELAAKPRRVDLAEFARSPGSSARLPSLASVPPSQPDQTPGLPFQLGAGDPDLAADIARGVDPTEVGRPGNRGVRPGEKTLVDSLIGQINGRPIFADEILEPIEDQLIAERNNLDYEQFRRKARAIVLDRMQAVVRNELYLAAAESSLSSEEQQGLLFLLRSMREQEIAKFGGGSLEEAERTLQRDEGLSLEEYLAVKKDELLLDRLVRQQIVTRVLVSWRDIEREYERHFDEFNLPATVTLSRIRLSSDQTDRIEEVKQKLAAGEDFGDVAEWAGMNDRGVMDTFKMGPGGLTDIEINDAYKPYLAGLEVGDTTEAFPVRNRTMWLHVTSIAEPEALTVYDDKVQTGIREMIFARRFQEEQARYMSELLEKSTLDELNEMVERVFQIALRRYGQ